LECRVVHEVEWGGSHRWFVGEFEAVQIEEGYTRDQALVGSLSEVRSVGQVVYKVERR
jgi:flavin reductase (DIM6/NTAB) family NADH-FMN oxidoreductase RutF